jgi:hypothetical protein
MNEAIEKETVHTVDGLPEIYTVTEIQTSAQPHFIPKLRGETFRTTGDIVVAYPTLDEAVQSLYGFLARMQ